LKNVETAVADENFADFHLKLGSQIGSVTNLFWYYKNKIRI